MDSAITSLMQMVFGAFAALISLVLLRRRSIYSWLPRHHCLGAPAVCPRVCTLPHLKRAREAVMAIEAAVVPLMPKAKALTARAPATLA
jgi:hypothetical protein